MVLAARWLTPLIPAPLFVTFLCCGILVVVVICVKMGFFKLWSRSSSISSSTDIFNYIGHGFPHLLHLLGLRSTDLGSPLFVSQKYQKSNRRGEQPTFHITIIVVRGICVYCVVKRTDRVEYSFMPVKTRLEKTFEIENTKTNVTIVANRKQ